MKTTDRILLILGVLCIVLAVVLLFGGCPDALGQIIVTPTTENKGDLAAEAKMIEVIGKVAGDWKKWMTIRRINTTERPERGFDPCMTFIVVDYKPMIKRMPSGAYQITFTSEIAEGLP